MFGFLPRHEALGKNIRHFLSENFYFTLVRQLSVAPLLGEVAVVEGFNIRFDFVNAGIDQLHLIKLRQADEGVGRNELRFQIRQRSNAVVVLFVAIGLLVADERDEESEFGDLDGDGLDIHTVEAVFDEVELAAVVVVVVLEGGFEGFAHRGGVEFGELGLFPAFVFRIELAEDVNEFVEGAHGECAGATSGVEDLHLVDGGDQGGDFLF